MSQSAKAQEPSMEEILASIRRIIADDDTAKPAAAKPAPASAAPMPPPRPAAMPPRNPVPASPPAPRPAAPPAPPPAAMDQRGIDAMLAGLDAPPGEASHAEDVLDLTEQMAAPAEGEAPSFQTIDGQADVFFADAPAAPEPRLVEEPRVAEQPPRQQQPAPQPSMLDRTLMSSNTSAAVDSAFNALAQTVLVQNARTLEDLVREMLRPLLKSWLDDNLPGMVERIVKAEIERVSRGR
jgi:cell pole-organizing protein PopZ